MLVDPQIQNSSLDSKRYEEESLEVKPRATTQAFIIQAVKGHPLNPRLFYTKSKILHFTLNLWF